MRRHLHALALLSLALAITAGGARAQSLVSENLPAIKYDFRGAWIATVIGLDWPDRTASTAQQQAELIEILDGLQAAGVNAVLFQIRSEADAMYESDIEPWSYWLTNDQGTAPDPYYDPLAFAIEEAHKRGMELHAWFNPYRAERSVGNYTLDPSHPKMENPDWIITTGKATARISILDPGLPDVRNYVRSIVLDVVERYDIDGVHFDDYFYPYAGIGNADRETYETYGQSTFASINTWRLFNINSLIRGVHEDIEASSKPWVVFGVSPFGIWRSGVPSGIRGLSAVDEIYADAVNWMDQQWVDYLAPQLYWKFGGDQDYAKLAPWWMSVRNERHIYPGLAPYRAPAQFDRDEVPSQIRFNRENGVQGQVLFRAQHVTQSSTTGFADSLSQKLWSTPALTPSMDWRDQTPPATPADLAVTNEGAGVQLTWTPPTSAEGVPDARRYAVYRFQSATPPPAEQILWDANNLIGITGEPTFVDRPAESSTPYHYVVASVSANSIESSPSNMVMAFGQGVDVERPTAESVVSLEGAAPNPFAGSTSIRFNLAEPARVSLTVYDVLGRSVARLADSELRAAGGQSIRFEAGSLPSGTYLVVLETEHERVTRPVLLVR